MVSPLTSPHFSSLAIESIKKTYEIERANITFEKNTDKLNPANTKETISKMKKELYKKNKEIKSLNQKLTDNLKKLRDETNLRAKAEVEVTAKESMIETLKEIVTIQKSTNQ